MTEEQILKLAATLLQHARHYDVAEPTKLRDGITLLPWGNASIEINGVEVTANYDEHYSDIAKRIRDALSTKG